jgi:hypothetical protein
MGTKLAIFLAFTSATLLFNTIVIWYAYKAFTNVSTNFAKTLHELQASDSAKQWLKTVETASFQAVTVSETVKNQLHNFDPVLARAQSKWEFRLAQVDVQMEKGVTTVLERTQKFHDAVEGPVTRLGAILSGVREVVQYVGGTTDDEDTQSRPKR